MKKLKPAISALCLMCAALLLAGCSNSQAQYSGNSFAMSTLITQTAYGKNAEKAAKELNLAIANFDENYSQFSQNGDIAAINAAAGKNAVEVSDETVNFLQHALKLSLSEKEYFAISIAPISNLWNVTAENPQLPSAQAVEQSLKLVNDELILIDGNSVFLPQDGMALDLGGIAKGEACRLAQQIYEKNKLTGAWLSIGGNIYAYGEKPDGSSFRFGFRDPEGDESEYIASFEMQNAVFAVSGGYERFFEANGERYIHIFDPKTGYPVNSDIIEAGVMHEDGATADFYSTVLFAGGLEKALDYMQNGGTAVVLAQNKTLYVSKALEASFRLEGKGQEYTLIYI